MVKIWPSNSLQAPTSVDFLGMVAVMALPRAPRPRPPLPLFSPRPPRPAGAAQAIFSCLGAPADSREMALALVGLAFSRPLGNGIRYHAKRKPVHAELFVPTRSLAPHALSCGDRAFYAFARVTWLPFRSLEPWGTALRINARSLAFPCRLLCLGERLQCRSDALWGSYVRSQRFARALVPDGFTRKGWMGRGGRPCLRAWS